MFRHSHTAFFLALCILGFTTIGATQLKAQSVANNPYHAVHGWESMPNGWKLGVPSGIFPDPDGKHLWILSRSVSYTHLTLPTILLV